MASLRCGVCLTLCAGLVGCTSTAPVQVSQSGKGAYEAALTSDVNGFAVAWYDTRDGNPEIYLRFLDAQGHPSGAEHRLTQTPGASYEASIDRLGDEFVIAWYEQDKKGEQTAMLGAWDRAGTNRWVQPIASASRNPVVRASGQGVFCAWIQPDADGGESAWAGWWDTEGRESRARVRLGPVSKTTWNLNVEVDASGSGWVVFDAAISTRANELFLAHVDANGARLERLTHDDGKASKYPDLAIDEQGRMALTWYDERDGNEEVYLLVGTSSDLHADVDTRARRVTNTPGESVGAYLAWNDGRVGLGWSDKDETQHEIYFQSFDAAGHAVENARRITRNATWSLVPAVRRWRRGFALAWNEYAPASATIHDGTSEVAFAVVE